MASPHVTGVMCTILVAPGWQLWLPKCLHNQCVKYTGLWQWLVFSRLAESRFAHLALKLSSEEAHSVSGATCLSSAATAGYLSMMDACRTLQCTRQEALRCFTRPDQASLHSVLCSTLAAAQLPAPADRHSQLSGTSNSFQLA